MKHKKRVTAIYLGDRKGNWEKEMIKKAKENNKILWKFTRDIQGKTKRKNEATYVYIEEERKAIEIVWELFIAVWKKEIYQKSP